MSLGAAPFLNYPHLPRTQATTGLIPENTQTQEADMASWVDELEGKPIEIFRVGDYGARGKYSEADLDQMVESFGALPDKPALTLHHDDEKGPHGQVTGVERRGGSLFATLGHLTGEIKAWLSERPYAERSVEIYPPSAETGGRHALRALSFVTRGKVKGMSPLPVFAEDGRQYVEIAMGDPEKQEGKPMPEEKKFSEAEVAEREKAAREAEAAKREDAAEKLFAEKEKAHKAEVAAFAEREKAMNARIAELEKANVRAEIAQFGDRLKLAGVAPAMLDRPGLTEFYEGLGSGEAAAIKFSEGGTEKTQSPREWFKSFLESMPKVVPMAHSGAGAHEGPKNFGDDPGDAKLAEEARKFSEAKKVDYETALRRVSAGERA